MPDQEKKEQEIMNQEMSQDEMETVAGGKCHANYSNVCFVGNIGETCDSALVQKNGRRLQKPNGYMNCAATVEDGSHCGSNDACYGDEVVYLGMLDCERAWQ